MFGEIYKNKCNDTVTLNYLMLNVYKIRKWLAACCTFLGLYNKIDLV